MCVCVCELARAAECISSPAFVFTHSRPHIRRDVAHGAQKNVQHLGMIGCDVFVGRRRDSHPLCKTEVFADDVSKSKRARSVFISCTRFDALVQKIQLPEWLTGMIGTKEMIFKRKCRVSVSFFFV